MDTFEFNGIQSDAVNMYIANIDGFSNNGVGVAGSEVTFNTSKSATSYRQMFNNATYETMHEFSFQFIKIKPNTCLPDEITIQEQSLLQRWLVRKDGYKYLRFMTDDYKDIYFNCKITMQWVRLGGNIIGAELKVTCDAPFGYSDVQTYEVSCADGNSFTVFDNSDEIGASYIDQMDILCGSNASTLSIKNSMEYIHNPIENRVTTFTNVVANEHISINGNTRQIDSSNNDTSPIFPRFNGNFPRLINTSPTIYDIRNNVFTVNGGSCNISMSYRSIRKAVR